MPPGSDIFLLPKGKLGKTVTFAELTVDGVVSGSFFDPDDTFLSYSYGLKGKPKDLSIFGSDANEFLQTGDGNDTIDMYGGDNIVVSGGGDDIITTTAGSNYIDGGDGNDTYIMDTGYDGDVDLSSRSATKTDPGTSDILLNIENVYGNDSDNTIIGDDAANVLATGGGTDTIIGGGGGDLLNAASQTGSKTFVGGTGDDTILAGVDADEFYWAAGDGADTVYYFDAGDGPTGDTLHLALDGDQSGSSVADLLGTYLQISNDGSSTTIMIDTTGIGTFDSASSITLDGVYTVADLEGNIVDDALFLA